MPGKAAIRLLRCDNALLLELRFAADDQWKCSRRAAQGRGEASVVSVPVLSVNVSVGEKKKVSAKGGQLNEWAAASSCSKPSRSFLVAASSRLRCSGCEGEEVGGVGEWVESTLVVVLVPGVFLGESKRGQYRERVESTSVSVPHPVGFEAAHEVSSRRPSLSRT